MAKKKWYAKLAAFLSNSPTTKHTSSRTTTRTTTHSTLHPTNRTTTHTTTRTTTRSSPVAINSTTTRTTTRTARHSTPHPANRIKPRSTQKRFTQPNSSVKSVQRPSGNHSSATTKKTYNLNKLKPKSAILFKEDFKCIFCFQLPKLPADEKRGIIICPHCRHPAHADEFKNWLKSSTLCSRCDRPISINFIRKPVIIPVIVYLKAMNVIIKKG